MTKKRITDSIIIGAALFAMFFGAGNMIFPPYLGMESGELWLSGFLGYYVADIGLAIVAILAQSRDGSFDKLLSPLGKIPAGILMLAIILCLGPFISIPRTCATTFELAILPNFEGVNTIIFSIIFFGVTLFLSLNESKVVDIVGKILTPVLIIGLLALIFKGVVSPISTDFTSPKVLSPVGSGIKAGYQSMDVLGATVFGVLVITSAKAKGHESYEDRKGVTLGASIVSGIGLLVIYMGLTYLGATASSIFNMHSSRTDVLLGIIGYIFPGRIGFIFFGVIAGLACLTTAIALTSSSANYLSKMSKGRLSYRALVVAICIFSAAASSLGVEKLVAIASPVLTVIYPPVLVIIILSFFRRHLTPLTFKLSTLIAAVYGVFEALAGFGIRFPTVEALPLWDMGLGWIIPSLIPVAIGCFVKLIKSKKSA